MFEFGPMHINMYGIMFAIAAVVATLLAAGEAKKRHINREIIYDFAFYLLGGGIIGARLLYVIFNWQDYMFSNFIDIFKIWEGGLAFFGGLIGAVAAGYVYVRKNNLNFGVYADMFVVPLVIGHIFGRLGDYFTGGHPGKVTSLPWGIYLDNAIRHPVVLYEIIGLIIILMIMLNLRKFRLFHGFLFSSYVMLYSAQRMILDFFRIELTDPRYFGLTAVQYIVMFLFILAAYFMITGFKCVKSESINMKKVKI